MIPDNISARIIREWRNELAYPLSIMFKKSIEGGIFPSRWAEANIVPIHTKGSRKSPENYTAVFHFFFFFFFACLGRVPRESARLHQEGPQCSGVYGEDLLE